MEIKEIIKTEKDLIPFYIGRIKGIISLKEESNYNADEIIRVLKKTLEIGEEIHQEIKKNK